MSSFSVGIAVEESSIRIEEFLTENRYWYEIIGLTNLSCMNSDYSFNIVKCDKLKDSYLVVDNDKVNNTVLRFSIESSNAEMKNVDFNYKVYPLYVLMRIFLYYMLLMGIYHGLVFVMMCIYLLILEK